MFIQWVAAKTSRGRVLQCGAPLVKIAISSPTAIWIVGVAISVFLFFDQELLSHVAGHFGHAGLLVVVFILPGGFSSALALLL
jgi:hypothetical protein